MEQRTTRIFGYDLIKTIAIFLIVFYHLGGVDYGEVIPGEYYLPNLAKFFSAFIAASVPLFLMVNGALIIPRKWTFHQAAIHSARLIFLYIFCKLLLQELLCKGIFGIEEEMIHFWFLRTLAIIYLFVPIFAKYPTCRKVLLSLLLVFPFISNLIVNIFVFICPDILLPSFAHSGFFTLYSFVFFYIGWIHKDYKWNYRKSFFFIVVGLLCVNFEVIAMSNYSGNVYDGANASFPTIGALAMSFGIYHFLKDAVSPSVFIRQMITYLGKNTLDVFILHVPIIFILRHYFFEYMNHFGIFESFSYTIILILLSIFFSFIIRKSILCF